MNLIDVTHAMDDLHYSYDVGLKENIHVKGRHGAEIIDGFDVVEVNGFAGVFVLCSDGEAAVSSRVVRELEEEVKQLQKSVEYCKTTISGLYRENAILKGEKPVTAHLNRGEE